MENNVESEVCRSLMLMLVISRFLSSGFIDERGDNKLFKKVVEWRRFGSA